MFPVYTEVWKYRRRTSARNRFRCFFFLSANTEEISIYVENEYQIQLNIPAESSRDGGRDLCFLDEKICISILHCTIILFILKEFQYAFFTFDSKEFKISLIKKHK